MENGPVASKEAEWDDTRPKDTWRNYSASGRLAGLLAVITFFVVFLPNSDSRWGLPVAILSAYSVLVFSYAFRDRNCSLSRPQVQEQLPKFALMHVPFLLLVYAVETEWMNAQSRVPHWLTVRGRKGSLYDMILGAILFLLAWWQVRWMRAIVKRSLRADGPAKA